MQGRHQTELEALRNDLEKQLPYKVKESSEFLNLKKMEEHMAKQKLYFFVYVGILRLIKCRSDCKNLRQVRRRHGSTPET